MGFGPFYFFHRVRLTYLSKQARLTPSPPLTRRMEITVAYLDPASFSETELREHYALTGLARLGVTYERALAHPVTHFPEAA